MKTLRVAKRRIYTFVLKRCAGEDICPVVGLYTFMSGCRNLDVDLSLAISLGLLQRMYRSWISR